MRVLCVCSSTIVRAARRVAERVPFDLEVATQDDAPDSGEYDLIVLLRVTQPVVPDESAEIVAVPLDGSTGLQTLNTVPDRIVDRVREYVECGGERNLEHALRYLAREVLGEDLDYEPPEELPWDGLYHPDHGLLEELPEHSERETIGVYLSREMWVWGCTDVPDRLIREVERAGGRALGVFTKPGWGRPLDELLTVDG